MNPVREKDFEGIPKLDEKTVTGVDGSLDPSVGDLTAPADPLAVLMPDGDREGRPDQWGQVLAKYMADNPEFAVKLEKGGDGLVEEEIRVIVATLEASGGDKMTLDVYASRLRLLEKEFVALAEKYPPIKRALAISRVNRKGAILDAVKMLAYRSTSVMKEYIQNPAFKDSLQIQEDKEEENFNSLEEKWEIFMREKGITPKDYTQVVYMTGDTGLQGREKDRKTTEKELVQQGFIPLDKLPDLFREKEEENTNERHQETQLGGNETLVPREIQGREGSSPPTTNPFPLPVYNPPAPPTDGQEEPHTGSR